MVYLENRLRIRHIKEIANEDELHLFGDKILVVRMKIEPGIEGCAP